jgi:hypothetical protein
MEAGRSPGQFGDGALPFETGHGRDCTAWSCRRLLHSEPRFLDAASYGDIGDKTERGLAGPGAFGVTESR